MAEAKGTSSAPIPKNYVIPNSASTTTSSNRPVPQKAGVTSKPSKAPASRPKAASTPKATSGTRPTPPSRKRTRSESLSDDSDSYASPPKRRQPAASHSSVSDEIWKLFGKDRSRYVEKDVFSDDEDMEADATALEMEEYRRLVTFTVSALHYHRPIYVDINDADLKSISARMAKKEDEAALADEMRHEQEKRRRKKEREARERRA